jgi:class 3 adenylate cyclase
VARASRLQVAANHMGVKILISSKAYLDIEDKFPVKKIPPIKVKGKKEPIDVYVIEQ